MKPTLRICRTADMTVKLNFVYFPCEIINDLYTVLDMA